MLTTQGHSAMTDRGACSFSVAFRNHYKFTGKERDAETGLDYFGARYYGNTMCRFMTPDWAARPTTVPYANVGNPQTLNLYSYVRNNPTSFYDRDGHCWSWLQGACNFFQKVLLRLYRLRVQDKRTSHRG
jgi:RHS repeat-associated protein